MKKNIVLILGSVVVIACIALIVSTRGSASSEPRTLNLGEFGIALTIPGSLGELTYEARAHDGLDTTLHMQVATCELGVFYTIAKNGIAKTNTEWTEETLKQFQSPQGLNPAQVKEFTDFYLVFEPSAPCTTDERELAEETKKRSDLWNALVTSRYMQY